MTNSRGFDVHGRLSTYRLGNPAGPGVASTALALAAAVCVTAERRRAMVVGVGALDAGPLPFGLSRANVESSSGGISIDPAMDKVANWLGRKFGFAQLATQLPSGAVKKTPTAESAKCPADKAAQSNFGK